MGRVIIIAALLLAAGCTKGKDCKIVTVTIINGCTTPATHIYIVKDKEYCGVDLIEIRKQAGYYDMPTINGICRVTTIVIEK